MAAIAMLMKKSRKVRPASGPRCRSSPSWTTPSASEANTSGITTKNSMRRNTCPIGSSRCVASHRAASSTPGRAPPTSSTIEPAIAPTTRPIRMRFASRVSMSDMYETFWLFAMPGCYDMPIRKRRRDR